MILVTGATGNNGTEIVKRLAAKADVQVRAMVRNRDRAGAIALPHVEVADIPAPPDQHLFQVPVHRIVTEVGLSPDVPPREGGIAVVQHLIPTPLPVDHPGLLRPEALAVLDRRTIESLVVLKAQLPHSSLAGSGAVTLTDCARTEGGGAACFASSFHLICPAGYPFHRKHYPPRRGSTLTSENCPSTHSGE